MNVVLLAGDGRGLLELMPLHAALEQAALAAQIVYLGGEVDAWLREGAIRELGGPELDLVLGGDGEADPAAVGRIVEAFKEYLDGAAPDVLVAGGETDAVMACCLLAAKDGVPIARLDAGRRGMASASKEVNHVIIDRLASHHFVSEPEAMADLLAEGVPKQSAVFVGNLLTDVFERLQDRDRSERMHSAFNLKGQAYAAVFLERQRSRPAAALELMQNLADQIQVLHLVDMRRHAVEDEAPLPDVPGVRKVETKSLRELLMLIERSRIVVTDADVIQEMAAFFEVPCLTVGRPIARPVTVTAGCNSAVPFEPIEVAERARELLASTPDVSRPPLWDGRVSRRIVDVLVRGYGRRLAAWISDYFVQMHRPDRDLRRTP